MSSPSIYHTKLGFGNTYLWGWSHLRFLSSTPWGSFCLACFLTFARRYIMSFEIKIHSRLLGPTANSLSTASNSCFWEHLILAKVHAVLPFLKSTVSTVERLILLPCIALISAMQFKLLKYYTVQFSHVFFTFINLQDQFCRILKRRWEVK